MAIRTFAVAGLVAAILPLPWASAVDLRSAVIVAPASLTPPEKKAVAMLADEVEKRTRLRPIVSEQRPASGPAIFVCREPELRLVAPGLAPRLLPEAHGAEGFRLQAIDGNVLVVGNDARGTLFGVGGLLRHLRMTRDALEAPDNLAIATAPKYALRGHQLGYRPKSNTYDGWDVTQWEQYIRDLAVFGSNAIELIPPRSDDQPDSPHFPLPQMRMMIEMSRLAASYGLDVWIWYPAMDTDYSDPGTVEAAVKEWGDVFRQLPRVDAVFVPGGDPGHTQPKFLMALLEKQTTELRRYHPKAQMWVSPQSFNRDWMEEFLGILNNQQPNWLAGVVYGPQIRMSLPELRRRVPQRYPIRNYPDITHSRQAQFPVPDWDPAFAATEARETINPRPIDEAAIFRAMQPYTVGFITYSEGSNDDVNKAIWSALGWNPDADVMDILRDFSRYFIGENYAELFANGLLALERNWRGSLIPNTDVHVTLDHFMAMERQATPQVRANWRFQQALYRAYYDAYTRWRLISETQAIERAMAELGKAKTAGSLAAMTTAEDALDHPPQDTSATGWRARIFELGEALFQSIRMQLSVSRYQAISSDRGANLDTIDAPITDLAWLKQRFVEIRRLTDEAARLRALDEIVNWTDPGPGGFYDDLGKPGRQPHLVRSAAYETDPDFRDSPLSSYSGGANMRASWRTYAESLWDSPLLMRYENLDRNAQYKLRVVYAGDSPNAKIRLTAGGGIEINPLIAKPRPPAPLEFEIPRQATATGTLELTWTGEQGLGGNGRGCQVAEVWLIKK